MEIEFESAKRNYQDLLAKKYTADLTANMTNRAQGERMTEIQPASSQTFRTSRIFFNLSEEGWVATQKLPDLTLKFSLPKPFSGQGRLIFLLHDGLRERVQRRGKHLPCLLLVASHGLSRSAALSVLYVGRARKPSYFNSKIHSGRGFETTGKG
jgi:hypothetical protein